MAIIMSCESCVAILAYNLQRYVYISLLLGEAGILRFNVREM